MQEVTFQLIAQNGFKTTEMAGIVTEKIGLPFKPVDFDPKQHSYLQDVQLADKFPNNQPRPINVLLSEPYFSQLQVDKTIRPKDPSLPIAQKTKLGWVLRGATGIYNEIKSAQVYSSLTYSAEDYDLKNMYEISFDFGKFWSGENVGIKPEEKMDSELTSLEEDALEFHKQTAKFDPVAKRWSVHLPWKDQDTESHRMSDNTSRALAYFYRSTKNVKEEHVDMVAQAYQDLVDQGFAEPVLPEEQNPPWPTYVMFSRPVIRMDKASTKVRVVINTSLIDPKDKTKSLNKMLMPGPNLLPQIMALILRLMQKEHIYLIDVKKMFLAVKLGIRFH